MTMFTYPFPMVSATATLLPIDPIAREIMLVKRAPHVAVHPNKWSLIGGFLEAKIVSGDGAILRAGENLRETITRESAEEANLIIDEKKLVLFDERSNPATDPRAHVINCCYYITEDMVSNKSEIGLQQYKRTFAHNVLKCDDDVCEFKWVDMSNFRRIPLEMAFNHYDIACTGIVRWELEEMAGKAIAYCQANGIEL